MSLPKLDISHIPAIHGGDPAFAERFRFIKPTLPALESVIAQYAPAYAQGMLTNSSLVARFEAAVAERLQARHCVAVSSCTSGLMMLLRALDLQGEIILPSFTFFATGQSALWNGLRPVLADCDRHTWTLDPKAVERKITTRTSAIMAVHLYGNPCDVEGLQRVADRHGLELIYDAAHAIGSLHQGRAVGGFGRASVFSLTPTKLLIAGEGGLITTNDAELAGKLRAARNYGDAGTYDPELLGLSARMSEFHAALGLAGLELVDRKVRRHNEIAAYYTDALSKVPGLEFQHVNPGNLCAYKDYSVKVDGETFGVTRDELAAALLAENIETRKYFYPALHGQKLFRDDADARRDVPHSAEIADGVLSLPVYESLPDSTLEGIVYAIARIGAYARG